MGPGDGAALLVLGAVGRARPRAIMGERVEIDRRRTAPSAAPATSTATGDRVRLGAYGEGKPPALVRVHPVVPPRHHIRSADGEVPVEARDRVFDPAAA